MWLLLLHLFLVLNFIWRFSGPWLCWQPVKWIEEVQQVGLIASCAVLCLVAQSCPTLCDPMDCSLQGSSVHGIFQARILEQVVICFEDRSLHQIYLREIWNLESSRERRDKLLLEDRVKVLICIILDFPGGSDGKESACNVVDRGSIPGSGRSLGAGSGNPLQYSCLDNSMDRGTWWASVHGVTKSWAWLSD